MRRTVGADLAVPNARTQVCLFYVILRALDTVGKSMAVFYQRNG